MTDPPRSGSTEVALDSFDMDLDGLVTGKDGAVDHRIHINAYYVLRELYSMNRQEATEAVLVHDAQQLMYDYNRIREVLRRSKGGVKSGYFFRAQRTKKV